MIWQSLLEAYSDYMLPLRRKSRRVAKALKSIPSPSDLGGGYLKRLVDTGTPLDSDVARWAIIGSVDRPLYVPVRKAAPVRVIPLGTKWQGRGYRKLLHKAFDAESVVGIVRDRATGSRRLVAMVNPFRAVDTWHELVHMHEISKRLQAPESRVPKLVRALSEQLAYGATSLTTLFQTMKAHGVPKEDAAKILRAGAHSDIFRRKGVKGEVDMMASAASRMLQSMGHHEASKAVKRQVNWVKHGSMSDALAGLLNNLKLSRGKQMKLARKLRDRWDKMAWQAFQQVYSK